MTTAERNPGSGDAGERIQRAGQDAVSDATAQARSQLDRGKSTAADTAASSSEVLEHAAEDFRAHGQETLARAASVAAGQLATLADRLEHRSLDELAREARDLARRNPGLFVAGGVAVGLALGRFFKASAPAPDAPAEPGAAGEYERSVQRSGGPAYGGEGAPPSQGSVPAGAGGPAAAGRHPVGGSPTTGASSATDPASTATTRRSDTTGPADAPSNSGNQGGKP